MKKTLKSNPVRSTAPGVTIMTAGGFAMPAVVRGEETQTRQPSTKAKTGLGGGKPRLSTRDAA